MGAILQIWAIQPLYHKGIHDTLHISTKIQPTAKATSHIIIKNVPATNMLLKCHIYAFIPIVNAQVSDNYVSTMSNIPHMNSLQSIMWPGPMVYIYFAVLLHASEWICLPHYTYMSHYTTATFIYHNAAKMCQKQTYPSNVIYMPHAKITWCESVGKYANIYDLTSINLVTKSAVHGRRKRHSATIYTELATWRLNCFP